MGFTLARDGQRPVQFQGTRLAGEAGAWLNGIEHKRYYDLAIYETTDQRLVVRWTYHSRWQGESNHQAVGVYATREAAAQALETFDPCAWVQGYKAILSRREPETSGYYAERQAQLEATIREHYAQQVSTLLTTIGCYEPVSLDQGEAQRRLCPACQGRGWVQAGEGEPS